MDNEYAKFIIPFVILSIVAAALLYLAYNSWGKCRRKNKMAIEMPNWPTATASSIDWIVYPGGMGRQKNFTLEITYSYHVDMGYAIDVHEKMFVYDGRDVNSDERGEIAKHDAEALGKSIVKEGKKVQIYYNPNNPSESAAEILNERSCVPIFIVVFVLSIFFLIFIIIALISLAITLVPLGKYVFDKFS